MRFLIMQGFVVEAEDYSRATAIVADTLSAASANLEAVLERHGVEGEMADLARGQHVGVQLWALPDEVLPA